MTERAEACPFHQKVQNILLSLQIASALTDFPVPEVEFPWYAVRTRSNYERTTSTVLAAKGYQPYLPMYRVKRRWSDREVQTELPLFPGYVFCRFDSKKRLPILSTPGVFTIVGFGNRAAPIPDQEIEAIERVLQSGLAAGPCPFIGEGQRIQIGRAHV